MSGRQHPPHTDHVGSPSSPRGSGHQGAALSPRKPRCGTAAGARCVPANHAPLRRHGMGPSRHPPEPWAFVAAGHLALESCFAHLLSTLLMSPLPACRQGGGASLTSLLASQEGCSSLGSSWC